MSAIKGSKELKREEREADAGEGGEPETLAVGVDEGADSESDSGKLKVLLGILKKVVGVKDLANLRLSLPANILSPTGNLEYWHYLDRPDLFATIGEKDLDPLARFVAVVRWTFSKELRYIRGRVCKPYNSALGEQFRCVWEVVPASGTDFHVYQEYSDAPLPDVGYPSASSSGAAAASTSGSATNSPALSAKGVSGLPKSMSTLSLSDSSATPQGGPGSGSGAGSPASMLPGHRKGRSSVSGLSSSSASSVINSDGALPSSSTSASASTATARSGNGCRVAFVSEQICHHPPISAFWYESTAGSTRSRVEASGVDQIAAKFNGTSVKIGPGSQNKGIFVRAPDATADEYQIVHPGGYISGLLSAKPYITLSETCFVNTLRPEGSGKGKAYRAIITYNEESWITKPRFLVEGVVYEVDSPDAPQYEQIKKVPEAAVVARIKGSWRGKITLKRTKGDKAESVLVDLSKLDVVPKRVRPVAKQDEMETRRFWEPVSNAINAKQYKQATAHKQTIEQAQRDKAAQRLKSGEEFVPVFFDPDISSGRATLTGEGKKVIKAEIDLVDHTP